MAADADLIRRLSEETFLGGNLATLDEVVSDDFVSHDPVPGFPPNKQGYRQVAELVNTAFSERKLEFDEFLETADGRIVENWAMTAKHTGDAFGLPGSGQDVRVRGVEIWRCSGGKLVEHWGAVDMSDVFEKAQAGSR